MSKHIRRRRNQQEALVQNNNLGELRAIIYFHRGFTGNLTMCVWWMDSRFHDYCYNDKTPKRITSANMPELGLKEIYLWGTSRGSNRITTYRSFNSMESLENYLQEAIESLSTWAQDHQFWSELPPAEQLAMGILEGGQFSGWKKFEFFSKTTRISDVGEEG